MEPIILLMWSGAVVCALIPVALWTLRWLSPTRDYFFLLLYGQVLIYLHVAPTLAASLVTPELQRLYLYIQAAALLLFDLPLALLYCKIMQRPAPPASARLELSATAARTLVLVVAAVVFSFWYLQTIAKYNLLFIRIGAEGVLDRFEGMPLFAWAGYRLFDKEGGVLACALLFLLLRTKSRGVRAVIAMGWMAVAGAYGLDKMINNRLDTILLVAVSAGVWLHARQEVASRRPWLMPALAAVVAVLGLYGFRVVNTVRSKFVAYGEIRAEWFSPFYRDPISVVEDDTPLYLRLNGIDLMAQITPRAMDEGFAHGKAWSGTLAPLILPFIDRDKANDLKRTFATDSKVYLMQHYTSYDSPDYFSSALMDAYGNFGLFGIMLSAVCLSLVCGIGTRFVLYRTFPAAPLVGLWLLYLALPFEHPLITLFGNGLRYSPMLIFLVALNPLRGRSAAAAVPAPRSMGEPQPLPG